MNFLDNSSSFSISSHIFWIISKSLNAFNISSNVGSSSSCILGYITFNSIDKFSIACVAKFAWTPKFKSISAWFELCKAFKTVDMIIDVCNGLSYENGFNPGESSEFGSIRLTLIW